MQNSKCKIIGVNAGYIVHFVKRYTYGVMRDISVDAIYFVNTKCDYDSQRSSDNYALRIINYELKNPSAIAVGFLFIFVL